jgi:hypothetical protein
MYIDMPLKPTVALSMNRILIRSHLKNVAWLRKRSRLRFALEEDDTGVRFRHIDVLAVRWIDPARSFHRSEPM